MSIKTLVTEPIKAQFWDRSRMKRQLELLLYTSNLRGQLQHPYDKQVNSLSIIKNVLSMKKNENKCYYCGERDDDEKCVMCPMSTCTTLICIPCFKIIILAHRFNKIRSKYGNTVINCFVCKQPGRHVKSNREFFTTHLQLSSNNVGKQLYLILYLLFSLKAARCIGKNKTKTIALWTELLEDVCNRKITTEVTDNFLHKVKIHMDNHFSFPTDLERQVHNLEQLTPGTLESVLSFCDLTI